MRFAVLALGLVLSACPHDDQCGPGGAPATGLVASGNGTTLTYGTFTGGLNNDCSQTSTGVISLAIMGTQVDGAGLLAFCVERPDLLATQAQAIGPDVSGSPVHLTDLVGSSGACSYAINRAAPITANMTASGLCDNGSNAAGFAFTVDGTVTLSDTCTASTVDVTLGGTVAFMLQN